MIKQNKHMNQNLVLRWKIATSYILYLESVNQRHSPHFFLFEATQHRMTKFITRFTVKVNIISIINRYIIPIQTKMNLLYLEKKSYTCLLKKNCK